MTWSNIAKVDIIFSDGTHWYWSTHCRHDDHDKCNATQFAPGVPRNPSQCKGCAAPCRCECHASVNPDVELPAQRSVEPDDSCGTVVSVNRDDRIYVVPEDDRAVPPVPPDADLPVVELDPERDDTGPRDA